MPYLNQITPSRKKFSRRKSFDLYKKVIELRKKGSSYTEIKRETGLAKSTIQNWLTHAGLTLDKSHFEIQSRKRVENYYNIGIKASSVIRAKKKDDEIQSFIQTIKKYFSDPFFIAGVMLYEAEGTKGKNNGFSNSDFRLIGVYISFLEKYLMLNKNTNMSFRLYIHDTRRADLFKITNFWSKQLSINPKEIKLSWKHNIVAKRRHNPDYVGQFEVRVKKFSNFTGKLLAVSDIILSSYKRNKPCGIV